MSPGPAAPVFIALTAAGLATAWRVQAVLGGEVHMKAGALPPPLRGRVGEGGQPPASPLSPSPQGKGEAAHLFADTADHLRSLFAAGRPIVGFCAAGILIRVLAPLLSDKRAEPPVIAASEDGASVVPLLGGHHGANDLAAKIAEILQGHAAITTAGDNRFGVALDDPPPGWTLANPEHAKPAMAALLAGASARLEGDAEWLRASRIPFSPSGKIRLIATTRAVAGDAQTLVYHPRTLAVGLGCERGAARREALELVDQALGQAHLSRHSLACVASIDLKADEEAILAVADHLGVPARFFSAAKLELETPRLQNPSEVVFREVGCHGVAEGAALAAAGPATTLPVPKQKSRRVTCAIANSAAIIDPRAVGRGRGKLAIIGIGPGSAEWLTPEARRLLAAADALVGYSLYLDLITAVSPAAERFDSALGSEEQRVRQALALAGAGRSVALVSSGDAGIYAMATLAFECLASVGLPDGAHRAEIVISPGISAMQAAAARAGAPLGHDFCAISLSDLLTPWGAIEKRIRAAAEADFVIAFYNPVSQRRRGQLAAAKDILLRHRPAETPVILARNLGREGEAVRTVPLSELHVDDVDMLTLVIVGASSTRQVTAAGRTWTYTPRGYEKKRKPSPPLRGRAVEGGQPRTPSPAPSPLPDPPPQGGRE